MTKEVSELELSLARLLLENQELKRQVEKLTQQLINLSESNRQLESQVFGGSTF